MNEVDKTVNKDAIVISVVRGDEKDKLKEILNIDNLERNVIIFDFSNTIYLNSAFISDLIEIHEKSLKNNFKLIISGMNKLTEDIFHAMGLTYFFKIAKNSI